jgi:parallel beta-helix repeat protein
LKADGSIIAWGYNKSGVCNVPEPNTDFIAIDAGYMHGLGIKVNQPPPSLTVYVDDDYNETTAGWGYDHFSSIQAGIDAVNENGTVYVYNGTYFEHITITKPLSLIGENKNTTIIDGNNTGDVVLSTAGHVTITGFTIQHSGNQSNMDAGVETRSHFNLIQGNIIRDSNTCVNVYYTSDNTVTENIMTSSQIYGIYLPHASHNTITRNTISDLYDGIHLTGALNNTITENSITSTNGYGISLDGANHNTISRNSLIHYIGIYVGDFSTNNSISENTITATYSDITLSFSSYNNISGNNITGVHTAWGLIVFCSDHNRVSTNNIDGSNYLGIKLTHATNNSITHNIISHCTSAGIRANTSVDNIITENNLVQNQNGCLFDTESNNNHLAHNNFINNNESAYDAGTNTWNNGYPSGGNYWDDYTGVDHYSGPNQDQPGPDGIGDTPYNISGGDNQDTYPFMIPDCWEGMCPVLSSVILTDENLPGLITCPAGDAPTYKHMKVTIKNYDAIPLQGIPANAFDVLVTDAGATWYGTLSATLIPVNPETDSNGTIQFEVRSDTAIIGIIGMQTIVSDTLINDYDVLPCRSMDYEPNGIVSLGDFVMFARDYGTHHWQSDFTWDGIVSLGDFVVFAQHYGHHS